MKKDNKLYWCLEQKKGISLIEPSLHLTKSYLQESDETLDNYFLVNGKWKIITAYYACYNAFYAILMKSGIKYEIHDCSLELMNFFEFTDDEKDFMLQLKEDRINVQYYLKEKRFSNEELLKKFILRCKIIVDNLNTEQINQIRSKLK